MRLNGSTIGPYQNADLINLALPGIYSLNEANLLKQQGFWKTNAFPPAYVSLINSFSLANRVYVSTYAELYSAINNASDVTQTAIILSGVTFRPGSTEALTLDLGSTQASAVIADLGKPITFICAPGQTIIEWTSSSNSRDGPMFYFTNSSSAIYGAYLRRNNNGNTLTYTVSFTRGPGGLGSVNNCVFAEINANGNWSRNYAPSTNSYTINYCSIFVSENSLTDNSTSAAASWNYCACNWAKTGSTPWLNSIENVSYNSDFTITGNSTQGVYAGTYAWDKDAVTVTATL